MKTLIKAFAVTTALTTSTFAPVQAHAEIKTLAECYQAVITWCNETYPDMDCSNSSGLDDCDEVFGDSSVGARIDRIFIQTWSDGNKTLRFETSVVEEEEDEPRRERERERDRDRDRDNDRDDARERPEREPTRPGSSSGDEHEVEYDVSAGV
jgi:hypothetical protein